MLTTRAMVTTAAVALPVALILGAAVGGLAREVDTARVDKASYAGGWQYVVQRQPDRPGAAAPELRTDDGIRAACARYADGFAQLDGFADAASFLAGCDDAARMTDLERG